MWSMIVMNKKYFVTALNFKMVITITIYFFQKKSIFFVWFCFIPFHEIPEEKVSICLWFDYKITLKAFNFKTCCQMCDVYVQDLLKSIAFILLQNIIIWNCGEPSFLVFFKFCIWFNLISEQRFENEAYFKILPN